jgi:hypothetical protein
MSLDSILSMLELVKPAEKVHMTTIVKLLNSLPAASRHRVMAVLNKVF